VSLSSLRAPLTPPDHFKIVDGPASVKIIKDAIVGKGVTPEAVDRCLECINETVVTPARVAASHGANTTRHRLLVQAAEFGVYQM